MELEMTMRIDRRLPVLWVAALSFIPIAQADNEAGLLRVQAYGPAAQGKVSRLLVNPFGEVDGLLLDTGTLVTFPPHMGEQLAAAVKPGDQVEVKGFPEAHGQISGYVITPSNSNRPLMVQAKPSKGAIKIPKDLPSAGLKAMNAQGEIRHLRYGKHGEINGMILADGTIVRFSRETSRPFVPLLKIGQGISASGYGTKNAYGQAFEATALNPLGHPPQPSYPR
jgi:hypothetical protein